jgi:hypothetical protein
MANMSMLVFEGYVLSWWSALPDVVQESYLDLWNAMKAAIRNKVLSINWFESQLLRLERMHFCSQGQDKETPHGNILNKSSSSTNGCIRCPSSLRNITIPMKG